MPPHRDKLSDEAIKARLNEALDGRTLQWLADSTGESRRNVERWLGRVKDSSTTPAHFIAKVVAALPVNPDWLLREEPPKERRPPGEAERRLEELRRMVLGED